MTSVRSLSEAAKATKATVVWGDDLLICTNCTNVTYIDNVRRTALKSVQVCSRLITHGLQNLCAAPTKALTLNFATVHTHAEGEGCALCCSGRVQRLLGCSCCLFFYVLFVWPEAGSSCASDSAVVANLSPPVVVVLFLVLSCTFLVNSCT